MSQNINDVQVNMGNPEDRKEMIEAAIEIDEACKSVGGLLEDLSTEYVIIVWSVDDNCPASVNKATKQNKDKLFREKIEEYADEVHSENEYDYFIEEARYEENPNVVIVCWGV